MKRIENYYFANIKGIAITEPKEGDEFYLVGEVFNHEGDKNGSLVRTSSVKSITDGRAETASGSVYLLGQKNKDYEEYMEAINDGTPILTQWRMSDSMTAEAVCEALTKPFGTPGTYETEINLIGESNGEFVRGRVLSQEGNYVTIRRRGETTVKYFVLWNDNDPEVEMTIALGQKYARCSYDKFEESFCKKCRPNLDFLGKDGTFLVRYA